MNDGKGIQDGGRKPLLSRALRCALGDRSAFNYCDTDFRGDRDRRTVISLLLERSVGIENDLPLIFIKRNAPLLSRLSEYEQSILELVLRSGAHAHHEQWAHDGTFHEATRVVDLTRCERIITLMIESGADLNFPLGKLDKGWNEEWNRELRPATIIDIATKADNLISVCRLHQLDIPVILDALRYAVLSEKWELVQYLVEQAFDTTLADH